MLSIQHLPHDQYDRLPVKIDPSKSIVVTAQDPETKEVKGFCAAYGVAHLEMWLDPAIQKKSGITGLKMLAELLSLLAANGDPIFYAFADRDEIADYLTRMGLVELPYRVFYGINPLLPQEQKECLSQLLSPPQSSEAVQDSALPQSPATLPVV